MSKKDVSRSIKIGAGSGFIILGVYILFSYSGLANSLGGIFLIALGLGMIASS